MTTKSRFGPERFFIERPTETLPFAPPHPTPSDKLLVWSGEIPLPQYGAAVRTALGKATVAAFFASGGFVGVMVAPQKPPAWWVKQNDERADMPINDDNPEWLARLACYFGAEVKES